MPPGISARWAWLQGKQPCPIHKLLPLGFLDPQELQKGMGGHIMRKPGCQDYLVLHLRDTRWLVQLSITVIQCTPNFLV